MSMSEWGHCKECGAHLESDGDCLNCLDDAAAAAEVLDAKLQLTPRGAIHYGIDHLTEREAQAVLHQVAEFFWPPGHEGTEWTVDLLDEVAETIQWWAKYAKERARCETE